MPVSSLISVHLSTIFAFPVAFLHSAPGLFSSLQLKMSETIFFLFLVFLFPAAQ